MNQKNAMKLFIHNADKPTSNKEIKKTETLKLRIKYKQTVCNKAENAIIHKNLIRHQNWMFKECSEYLLKNIRYKDHLIWKDTTDRFIRFCQSIDQFPLKYEVSKRKFKQIQKYFKNQCEMRPNYMRIKGKELLMRHRTEKQQRRLSMISQADTEESGSSESKSSSQVHGSKVFTSSFYQNISELLKKDDLSYRNSERSTNSETPYSKNKDGNNMSTRSDKKRTSIISLLKKESLVSWTREFHNDESDLDFRVNLSETAQKPEVSETNKIKEMKQILKSTINNVSSIRNSEVENSEFQATGSSSQTNKNRSIMDIINQARLQQSPCKTIKSEKEKTQLLVKDFKKRPRVSIRRIDSNLLLIKARDNSNSVMGQYSEFRRRANSIRASPSKSKSRLESISENANASKNVKDFSKILNKYQFSCPLPPKDPKIQVEHKRNYSTLVGDHFKSLQPKIEPMENEEIKEFPKNNLFENFNKKIRNCSHKRSISRNEDRRNIDNQFSESNSPSKATQVLTKRGDVLPPIKSKIIILHNQ